MLYGRFGDAEMIPRIMTAARLITARYGDTVAGGGGRTWDCSYFVGQIIRGVIGLDDVFPPSKASYQITPEFASLARGKSFFGSGISVYFLYDSESDDHPNHSVHVGIGLNFPGYNRLVPGSRGTALSDLLVIDLYEITGVHEAESWSVHRGSDWFNTTPLADVGVVAHPGASAPDFGSDRFVVSGGFIRLSEIIQSIDYRA